MLNKVVIKKRIEKNKETDKIHSSVAMQKNGKYPKAQHIDAISTEDSLYAIREKLDDPAYIEGAVYRLATIITNQILILRGEL